MGLITKQVYDDDYGRELDQTLVEAGSPELKCPRCGSANTKFCYFNNYNKSQPRHFCKSCKKHWTKGGTLRNVPAGGGRKNKRLKITNSATASSSLRPQNSRNLPLISNNKGDQKTMSNNLYHALIGSRSSSLWHYTHTTDGIQATGLNNVSVPSCINPKTECSFSFLNTNFDIKITSLDSNPTTCQFLKAYGHYSSNLDSIEESMTITTVNTTSSTRSVPWPNLGNCSSTDLPSYWDWNYIDNRLSSSDHLNISWDDINDLEIKPYSQF